MVQGIWRKAAKRHIVARNLRVIERGGVAVSCIEAVEDLRAGVLIGGPRNAGACVGWCCDNCGYHWCRSAGGGRCRACGHKGCINRGGKRLRGARSVVGLDLVVVRGARRKSSKKCRVAVGERTV